MNEESKCPVTGRTQQTHGRQWHVEPGLVAEPVEPQDSPPELSLDPIPWARRSTTLRNSRNSTWRP
jgi:hypothetical protein